VAARAGVSCIGLEPKRRTTLVFNPPAGVEIAKWPNTVAFDEDFYFKPEAGKILASPCDETPVPPCDVQPDELDIAVCIDRIQKAADLPVRRIERAWAGLRSFVSDRAPVLGFAPEAPGFFWLAGQGGYGIQTAPAMARAAAALIASDGLPGDLRDLGLAEATLSPARFAVVSA
jgi:D-arginine dehydrogenase